MRPDADEVVRELHDHKTTYLNTHHVTVVAVEPPDLKKGHAPDRYRIELWGEPLEATLVDLKFHTGSPEDPSGVTDQALLAIVLDRWRAFQKGPLANRQTALAITKLEEALLWQLHRTREREAAGVEGTSHPLASKSCTQVFDVTGCVARGEFPFTVGPLTVLDHENDVLVVRVTDPAPVNNLRLTTQPCLKAGLYGVDFEVCRIARPETNALQVLAAARFRPVSAEAAGRSGLRRAEAE